MASTVNMLRPPVGAVVQLACAQIRQDKGDKQSLFTIQGRFLDLVVDNNGQIEGYSIGVPQAEDESGKVFPPVQIFVNAAQVLSVTWEVAPEPEDAPE